MLIGLVIDGIALAERICARLSQAEKSRPRLKLVDKVRKANCDAVKAGLLAVMNAPSRPKALSAARRFADAWEETYPKAVARLHNDVDDGTGGTKSCVRREAGRARLRLG